MDTSFSTVDVLLAVINENQTFARRMGGAVSAGEDNDELIDNLVEAEYIKSPHVERIFRAVDRGDYYIDGCKENAYRDLAWKHGNIHLSAPCIYSEVMENLKLEPGLSFLNLGSGTGYLSTMAGLVLGTYGTNHGVELHDDVVEYAKAKLEEFQSTSPAMDKYEFCPPNFVVGNCLLLDSTNHQYDRVYCGASCPSEHENYMKNLVRVGGILVMPLNDHLLQVTRTGETTYEVKNVLPVSFASLVPPMTSELHTFVKLPEKYPLTLQEICRSAIRILLRTNAETENPSLKDKKKLVPTKRRRTKRRVRKVVIPVLSEGERLEEDDLIEFDEIPKPNERRNEHFELAAADVTETYEDLRRGPLLNGIRHGGSVSQEENRIKIASGPPNLPIPPDDLRASSSDSSRRASSADDVSRRSDDESNRRDSFAEASDSGRSSQGETLEQTIRRELEESKKFLMRENELFAQMQKHFGELVYPPEEMDIAEPEISERAPPSPDVYVVRQRNSSEEKKGKNIPPGVNADSGIDNISDESVPEESSSDPEKTEVKAGSSKPSTSQTLTSAESKLSPRPNQRSPYLKRSAENEVDTANESMIDQEFPGLLKRKALIFKRLAYSDLDSDEEDGESDSGKESSSKDYETTREKSDLSCYTYHMRQKINMLPLPHPLKVFLNFSRPV